MITMFTQQFVIDYSCLMSTCDIPYYTYRWVCNDMSNKTGGECGAGFSYPD